VQASKIRGYRGAGPIRASLTPAACNSSTRTRISKRPGAVRMAALRGLRRLAEHAEVRQRRAPVPPRV